MDKRNYSNGLDMPLGLAMAMAQNPLAMEYFTRLTSEQKQQLISSTHSVHSKEEMHRLVENMADGSLNTSGGIYTDNMNPKFNI
ncbi:hypothetical protein [Ruminococcus sp. Marseille-P6503]|uniref:hypothetical protein n=1 Tax=Ruminococcus sp. Marseille-P6503 TaxID=2364796 RepID=UPI000F5249BD|nr:hypothetical protein [Ruminococcus sp. Marseille-P6503]